jgi:hypothetical protein
LLNFVTGRGGTNGAALCGGGNGAATYAIPKNTASTTGYKISTIETTGLLFLRMKFFWSSASIFTTQMLNERNEKERVNPKRE